MRLVPTLDRQRWFIISVWFGCLIINAVLILYLDFSQYRLIPEGSREPFNKLSLDLLAMYAPPLTIMLAIGYARKPTRPPCRPSLVAFVMSILLSAVWNGIMIWENAQVSLLHTLDIQSVTGLLPTWPGALSFLINPFLAFYFSSDQS